MKNPLKFLNGVLEKNGEISWTDRVENGKVLHTARRKITPYMQ
jgi:hypothetical protein